MPEQNEAAIVRAWLVDVLRKTGLKPTPLAKAADIAPSTILRALDPERGSSLDMRTIMKIVDKLQVAPPPALFSGVNPAATGFAAPELAQIEDDAGAFAGRPLAPTQGLWRVGTRALELAGYLPDDLVLADSAVPPRPRDIVVAQIIDHRTGAGETVLRLYEPPYLVTETADPAARARPELVDNDRVAIWGTVVMALRTRAA